MSNSGGHAAVPDRAWGALDDDSTHTTAADGVPATVAESARPANTLSVSSVELNGEASDMMSDSVKQDNDVTARMVSRVEDPLDNVPVDRHWRQRQRAGKVPATVRNRYVFSL